MSDLTDQGFEPQTSSINGNVFINELKGVISVNIQTQSDLKQLLEVAETTNQVQNQNHIQELENLVYEQAAKVHNLSQAMNNQRAESEFV